MGGANATDRDLRIPFQKRRWSFPPQYLVRPIEAALDGNELSVEGPCF